MEKLTINIIKVLLGTLTFCVLFVLPPVYGKYCASKGCCLGRDDDCSSIFPIQGPETLCYCDSFCNRTNTDCCPDFFEFCLGIKPPPLPHRHDGKYTFIAILDQMYYSCSLHPSSPKLYLPEP